MAKQSGLEWTSGGGSHARPALLDELIEVDGQSTPTQADSTDSVLMGHLAGIDASGRVLFRPEGSSRPLVVSIGMAVADAVIVRAARVGQRAVVHRTSDRPSRFVLTGLVRERISTEARDAGPGRLEVSLDGESVSLTASHRIELRCGKSSLTLTKEGRVVLKGAHVVSRSTGPNKIKGASIALN